MYTYIYIYIYIYIYMAVSVEYAINFVCRTEGHKIAHSLCSTVIGFEKELLFIKPCRLSARPWSADVCGVIVLGLRALNSKEC